MIKDAIAVLEDDMAGWKAIGGLTTEEWFQMRLLAKIIRLSHRYARGLQIHDDYDVEGNQR